MRIAVFVEFFPPNLGSDRRIYELMTRLSKKHQIHFLVLPPFRLLSGEISSPQSRYHFQKKEIIAFQNGITAHYIPASRLMLNLWKKSYTLAYVLTLVSVFLNIFKSTRKINPELIILNYPSIYTGILGFLIGKKLLRKPVLVDFNDLIAQYSIRLLNLRPYSVVAWFCISIQNLIVKNSDKIIVTTNYIKKYALNLGVADGKIAFIPNGVDLKHFDPSKYITANLKEQLSLADKKICLYCGRLDNWAGINVIFQLSKAFNASNSSIYFVIVGSGAQKNNNFAENAIFLGDVQYGKVPGVLAVADVVLVPFPDNEVSRAASPLKLFEAMAMGKAVVASKVDGIEEVICDRENGLLVDPDNITEWIEAVKGLLNDNSAARRMGDVARLSLEHKYDWKLLAEDYQKVIRAFQSY
jgi:glycosyltransferase involved in cell wall biosynthesis